MILNTGKYINLIKWFKQEVNYPYPEELFSNYEEYVQIG